MREEFLSPRSQFPPFDGIPSEKLPENFDYSRWVRKVKRSEYLRKPFVKPRAHTA
jgi:hypothetical protein